MKGFGWLGRNASERRITDNALRLAASVFDDNPDGIMITDAAKRILRVNRAFCAITGFSADEVLGRTPKVLSSGRHDNEFFAAMWRTINRTGRWSGEIWNRRKSGEAYPEWLSITTVTDDSGGVLHYVGTFADITGQKEAESEIERLAFRDALTGLPNRRLFAESLALTLAQNSGPATVAVILVDLDRFTAINNGLGYAEGDRMLQVAAERIRAGLGDGDLAGRWYGDQFAVLLRIGEDVSSKPVTFAEELRRALWIPIDASGRQIHITATLGIAVYPRDAQSASDLIRAAESALREAKVLGPDRFRFFDPDADAASRERLFLEEDLHSGIRRQEFRIHYQPQFSVVDRRIVGAEALLRWMHPRRGLISPSEFIPVAENAGLISELTRWMIVEVCAQASRWRKHAPRFRVSVNMTPKQFHQEDVVLAIRLALEATSLPPGCLGIEITEGVLLDHKAETLGILKAIRDLGVGLSVDDFGTGFSSLSYLKRLPIDTLKLDKSFVSGLPADANDAAIAVAVLSLARALNLKVVAEGVETEEQLAFLREHGCGEFQGFLGGPAMPPAEFGALLDRSRL